MIIKFIFGSVLNAHCFVTMISFLGMLLREEGFFFKKKNFGLIIIKKKSFLQFCVFSVFNIICSTFHVHV